MKTKLQTRPEEIVSDYTSLINEHLDDLLNNRVDRMFEIEDFAAKLFIHPNHLSNTIKGVTGQSACGIYQIKILETAQTTAQTLLTDQKLSIKEIALSLTFEPSQFTKWFKKLNGQTPQVFRKILKS